MSQIQFRGATLRYIDVRPTEGGTICRLHMRSDLTDTVLEELEWEAPPEQMTGGKFSGKLSALHATLTPTQAPLQKYELQLDVDEVGEFQYGVIQGKEDSDPEEKYLAFTVRTRILGACAMAENYLAKVGTKETGLLSIQYQEQAEQLPLEASDASKKPQPETGDTLLPAAVAAGGMDKLKKERKGRQKAKAAPGDGASCEVIKPEVEGEAEPIREHNWTLGKDCASVRIFDDHGALRAAVLMDVKGVGELAWEAAIEGPQSIPHLGVTVATALEQECRDRAKVNGITAETKHALAQLLSWSREVAGEYRMQGRTAAESKQAAAEAASARDAGGAPCLT